MISKRKEKISLMKLIILIIIIFFYQSYRIYIEYELNINVLKIEQQKTILIIKLL